MFRPAQRCQLVTSTFYPRTKTFHHRNFRTGAAHLRNHYQALGLDSDAGSTEIKKAYYDLSKKYHPDRNPDDAESLKRFHAIAEAYSVLGDPRQRRLYDKGSFNSGGGGVADEEAIKHTYKGEDFIKGRAEHKDKYSGDYCDIKSRRQSDLNRQMDDYVMGVRRTAFLLNKRDKENAGKFKDIIVKKTERPGIHKNVERFSRSPYMSHHTPPPSGGGGGGGGNSSTSGRSSGSPIPAAFFIILVLIFLSRM